jgi:hypothetical protein
VKVQLESKIVNLIVPLEKDVTKVVHEALNLWLKERLIICPITNQFCINPNIPCNDCTITKK